MSSPFWAQPRQDCWVFPVVKEHITQREPCCGGDVWADDRTQNSYRWVRMRRLNMLHFKDRQTLGLWHVSTCPKERNNNNKENRSVSSASVVTLVVWRQSPLICTHTFMSAFLSKMTDGGDLGDLYKSAKHISFSLKINTHVSTFHSPILLDASAAAGSSLMSLGSSGRGLPILISEGPLCGGTGRSSGWEKSVSPSLFWTV